MIGIVNSRESQSQEARLRRMLDVGRGLVSEFDLEAVLERVLDAARELTGARYAALGVLDPSGKELERFLTVGVDEGTRRTIGELPRGRGVLGVLISEPRPLRLAEVGAHPRSYGFPPGHPSMHTFLGVPILLRGQAYGNLYLTEKQGDFDSADEEALVVLAEWAAIAIENARAYSLMEARRDELERAAASFEATSEISQTLAGDTDLEHVLELIVKRGRALTDARAMVVMLEQGSELVVAALAGDLDNALLGERIPIEESISGHVLRSGKPERLADAPSRLRFEFAKQTQAQTGLFVPLRFRGRVLGVLAALDRLREGPQFSGKDERLLSAFAASAAAAVATAQDVAAQALRRSIAAAEQERTRWARELHDETLQELAALKLLLATVRIAKDTDERDTQLKHAADRIDVAVRALRNLITDLRPPVLDEYGLQPALEALAERMQAVGELTVELQLKLGDDARGQVRLPPQVEDSIYRVIQEALANVVKHSGATRAMVRVREADETVQLSVSDEGKGFAVEGETNGFGLLGMRERLALVDGTISIESTAGEGTTVRAAIPARRAFPSETASANA
jgi:two-component system, NarL family, sensor histidine kinase DevS